MYISLEGDGGDSGRSRVAKTIPLGEGKYMDVTESNEPLGLEIILPRNVPDEAIDAIVNRSGKSRINVLQ